MKKVYLLSIQMLILFSLTFSIGCSKDDSSPSYDYDNTPGETNPDTPVTPKNPDTYEDPEGTATANISESTSIEFSAGGYIRWTSPDNFYLFAYPNSISICDVGEVKGLGYITDIPQTGYITSQLSGSALACETGHGYVIRFDNGSSSLPLYVRLYVAAPLINGFGEIIGKKVQYQYPFDPTGLKISTDTLRFQKRGGTQTVTITTNSSISWAYSPSDSWIGIRKINDSILSITVEANNISNRRGIITIQANESRKEIIVEQATDTYAIGDIYSENGVTGIVYKVTDDGRNGMIVSMEEASREWSLVFETTNCSGISDGMQNMNIIKNIVDWETKYPAFKWCDDFNRGSISGWYLPAQSELDDIFKNRAAINATLINSSKPQIQPEYYWSSTESNDNITWCQNFSNGLLNNSVYNKKESYKVRAVRAF
ncbi:hypothetical protein FACS189434_03840 [Bacteroidia bacterium]|nr:hypothetical protein FACS189434_03840 [Bacteroidia bacterium]